MCKNAQDKSKKSFDNFFEPQCARLHIERNFMEYTVTRIKGDGYTATIRRPILSDAERVKREKIIIETLKSIYREEMYNEARKQELLLKDSK